MCVARSTSIASLIFDSWFVSRTVMLCRSARRAEAAAGGDLGKPGPEMVSPSEAKARAKAKEEAAAVAAATAAAATTTGVGGETTPL